MENVIRNGIYSRYSAMHHGGTTMSSVSVPEKVREVGKIVTPLTIVNH